MKKIQNWIDAGKYEQALERFTTLHYYDHVLADTAMYAELLDPYAILLERRLQQGDWDQGLLDFGRLSSTPGWGSLLEYNRRAIKAVLTMHCAKGNWSRCETMLKHLRIEMTSKTVARMMGTLMELKTPGEDRHSMSKYAVRGQHIVWALQTFERRLGVQVSAEALSRMVGYLGDRGLMEDAYRIYCWARKESTTGKQLNRKKTAVQHHHLGSTHRASKSILYLTMIEAAILNNDTAKAERIWHERMYRGTFNNTITFRPASLSSYNILLNIYASQLPTPNLARVHRTYRRMLNAGYSPSTYTYNILIKAFVNVEQFVQRLSSDGVRLDKRAFNIMLMGFLQLDGRIMAIDRLLKAHGDWTYWKYMQTVRKPYTLTSSELWRIWTSVTGQTKNELEQHYDRQRKKQQRRQSPSSPSLPTTATTSLSSPPSSTKLTLGFAALFEQEQEAFNQVSCKLFIKAFTLANDPSSADIVKEWMFYSYPPILEKKPLL
ncbi:hypothetical protein BCR42DRAFT_493760 [Absidia repens]|uniref:Uncharacterized protein n=1 Tax=Absidia repens TaxID=90262 RepID=A0A1X2I9W8_9FUNG|nr:hypothetical protein BCR42DRAFT_493760 [Absidia repens]